MQGFEDAVGVQQTPTEKLIAHSRQHSWPAGYVDVWVGWLNVCRDPADAPFGELSRCRSLDRFFLRLGRSQDQRGDGNMLCHLSPGNVQTMLNAIGTEPCCVRQLPVLATYLAENIMLCVHASSFDDWLFGWEFALVAEKRSVFQHIFGHGDQKFIRAIGVLATTCLRPQEQADFLDCMCLLSRGLTFPRSNGDSRTGAW